MPETGGPVSTTTLTPDLQAHIAALVDEAPPLTDTIRDRIAALIRAGVA